MPRWFPHATRSRTFIRVLGRVCTTLVCSVMVFGLAVNPMGAAKAAPKWEPPLGHPLQVSRAFSLANGPYHAGHRGIDLPAVLGQPVRAPVDGTVSFVGVVVDRPVLSIRVDAQTVLSFEPVISELSEGDSVERGQILGEVAQGHCATPCAHMGVRIDGAYVNPLRFLRIRAELLPW